MATTYTVSSTSDDINDTGSLRYAISQAQEGDEIVFADALSGETIRVTETLTLTRGVTIDGGSDTTISGRSADGSAQLQTPIFTVAGGNLANPVTIENLAINDGNAVGETGTKGAKGTTGSTGAPGSKGAPGGPGGPGGDGGNTAGGIYVNAGSTLVLTNDSFTNLQATGGSGGIGGLGGTGGAGSSGTGPKGAKGAGGAGGNAAGAVYVEPGATVTASHLTFTDVSAMAGGGSTAGSADDISNSSIVRDAAVCYADGTRIHTAIGEVAVEDLRIGDRVVTVSGEERPIQWIGVQSVDCRQARTPEAVRPIRVLAGAFAPGLPRRDLFVSPDHAFFFDDVLIPAWALINGSTVRQVEAGEIRYYGIELASHDMVLAEGVAAESYLDDGMRDRFDNYEGDGSDLNPLRAITREGSYRPRAMEGRRVAMVRAWIDARAEQLGQPAVYDVVSEVLGPAIGETVEASAHPVVNGCIERVSCDRVSGWAWMPERPQEAVKLELVLNGTVIAAFAADRYRRDLEWENSDGRRGFDLRLPPEAYAGIWARIEVRVRATGQHLDNSPALALTRSPEARVLV